jgi:hypothetical protein
MTVNPAIFITLIQVSRNMTKMWGRSIALKEEATENQ